MTKLQNNILEILNEDSRYNYEKIATMLGDSEENVEKAILELEAQGIIVKYTTIINEEKIGNDFVEALIEVKVAPQQSSGFDDIAKEIYVFDEVKSLYLMSGAYDLAITVECKSLRDVARFVSEKLSTINSVLSTATHFILKKYKTEGVLLEDNASLQRIAVQPWKSNAVRQ